VQFVKSDFMKISEEYEEKSFDVGFTVKLVFMVPLSLCYRGDHVCTFL
jgi:hypothetical protein